MQQGIEEARRYVRESTELRQALGIGPDDPVSVEPLAQGEHNSNFCISWPARTAERAASARSKAVLRLNYASQMGLENQVSYEFNALRQLERSGRTPCPLFVDDSKRIIERGVLAMEFVEGTLLEYECEAQVAGAAAVLADIHSVRPAESCGLAQPSDPLREQFRECLRLFDGYRRWADADTRVITAVDGLLSYADQALDAAPPATDRAHILNTEAVSDHFIFPIGSDVGKPASAPAPQTRTGSQTQPSAAAPGSSQRNDDVAADGAAQARMVDWEKPILGEAAQDIAYFLSPTTTIWKVDFIFTDEQRDRFISDYWRAVDGRFARNGFDERFAAYVMTNCLRGITWSANALVEYSNPDRALKNADTEARLGLYVAPEFLDMVRRRFFQS